MISNMVRICVGLISELNSSPLRVTKGHEGFYKNFVYLSDPLWLNPFMRIIYFSLGYSTHDHRFLKAISDGGHDVFFLQLEGNKRQMEDRPIPENVRKVIWKGGREPFRWSKLPVLVLDFKRILRELKPDLVHAGPIQTCAFIAI